MRKQTLKYVSPVVQANTVLVQRKQERVLASRVLPAHLVTVERDKQVQRNVKGVHPESIAIAEQVSQTGKLAKTALLENFQLEKAK